MVRLALLHIQTPIVGRLVRNVLAVHGIQVLESASREEAFAMLRRGRPDLVALEAGALNAEPFAVIPLIRYRLDDDELPILALSDNPRIIATLARCGPTLALPIGAGLDALIWALHLHGSAAHRAKPGCNRLSELLRAAALARSPADAPGRAARADDLVRLAR